VSLTTRLQIPYPAGGDTDDVPNWMNQLAVKLDGMVAPMSHGTLTNRPTSSVGTPGIADRFYYATDVDPDTLTDRGNVNGQLYRDNGTGWDPVGPFASKIAAGNFSSPASTGNQDTTGLGFSPKMVEFTFSDQNSTSLQAMGGEGVMTATQQWSLCWRSRASSNNTVNDWRTTACICMVDLSSTVQYRATFVSMLGDGFRINWATTAGTGLKVGWKAWG
jgi:hypothetical protein